MMESSSLGFLESFVRCFEVYQYFYSAFEISAPTKTYNFLNLISVLMGYTHCDITEDVIDPSAVQSLTKLLESELKSAKSNHLACGEVLLPSDLLKRVAQDIYFQAEKEPCGVRGCMLYINFETEESNTLLSVFKLDSDTPTTFELYLTLKQTSKKWNAFVPQFLK